ncbi:MAG: FKBP-type peptidyl-prolyl cis-trans isomerase [Bacteroidaceae bacterium]|nr:FKBP-type peptidyl-prolyl cis-trans isomerase [Bacteroidaceae bacterium]
MFSIAKLHVGSLIPGFAKALCMLPEGTKCKVYIPWELGYGAKGTRRIPPYSTLVFDIEVAKVIKNR